MRPIDRGAHPVNLDNTPIVFPEYSHARQFLIDQLGEYCSYCEMHLDASLAVEHVKPKNPNPHLALAWDNFLLSCTNCNSIKGDQDINLSDYYWPDSDNTSQVFCYQRGGVIQINLALNANEQLIATKTLELTGLTRTPINNPTASDRRWNNRREAWDMAERARQRLLSADTQEMREQIVDTARAKGYWSVWMAVFADDADICNRLIDAFPGTCRFCQDTHFTKPSYCMHKDICIS